MRPNEATLEAIEPRVKHTHSHKKVKYVSRSVQLQWRLFMDTDTHKKPILLEQDITWHVWCLPLLTSYKTTVMVGWVTSEMVEDRTEVRHRGERFLYIYQFGNDIGRSDRSEQHTSSRRIQSRFSRKCSNGLRKTWKNSQCRQSTAIDLGIGILLFTRSHLTWYIGTILVIQVMSLPICTILMPIFVAMCHFSERRANIRYLS